MDTPTPIRTTAHQRWVRRVIVLGGGAAFIGVWPLLACVIGNWLAIPADLLFFAGIVLIVQAVRGRHHATEFAHGVTYGGATLAEFAWQFIATMIPRLAIGVEHAILWAEFDKLVGDVCALLPEEKTNAARHPDTTLRAPRTQRLPRHDDAIEGTWTTLSAHTDLVPVRRDARAVRRQSGYFDAPDGDEDTPVSDRE